ncbi:MAG: hypothetical protein JNJ88_19640 [Planctomycetes bacterium]|nr:hypothetical protein [Planctomycetota bacterium]
MTFATRCLASALRAGLAEQGTIRRVSPHRLLTHDTGGQIQQARTARLLPGVAGRSFWTERVESAPQRAPADCHRRSAEHRFDDLLAGAVWAPAPPTGYVPMML